MAPCGQGRNKDDCENEQRIYCAVRGYVPEIDSATLEEAFATDEEQKNVSAYAVFMGTHTGQGGPCPPTGNALKSDYVYVIYFDGDKIRHIQKIWHASLAMKELGWT
jgi:hypothetical protein